MSLTPGTTLGPYSVIAQIGAGGMGEVYRARDTKLDRDVALKVLPEAFTADPDRLARFEREAKVLASLNHPNIGHIYGLEEAEGTKALVLELVEGPTLADRIKDGPIPIDEALPIAKQIAEALEAAHEQGIIHRDLKPANVKVKEDGTVKVLDFGLAKAFQPEASGASASESPTIPLTAAATQMGMVIGTAAYMAPEQASGKPVDKRADVWAFGVVLYEMLTGARPFVGDDMSKTLAHVIAIDPDWGALPKSVPPVLGTFLRGCLAKNPKQRVHDVADVRLAMDGAFETTVQATAEPSPLRQLPVWQQPMAVAIVAAAIAGLAVWAVTRPEPPPASKLVRFAIVAPETAPFEFGGFYTDLAITSDGTQIVYQTRPPGGELQLYLRPIDQLAGVLLRGTERGVAPFASPDGEWVGFVLGPSNRTLQKVSIVGGPPVTLAEFPAVIVGATWRADDQIIVGAVNGGLFRVSGGGGEPEVLTTLDADQGEVSHAWPAVIPDRQAVLFSVLATDASQLAVLALDTGEVTRLGLAGSSPQYVSTGHLVYAVPDGSLRAVPFDADSLDVTGTPVPLVEGVMVKRTSGAANFSVSDDGSLVYVPGAAAEAGTFLVWVDRNGSEEPINAPRARYQAPRISPEGRRVAVTIADQANDDIWVIETDRGTRTRLTTHPERDIHPLWTLDGQRITFSSNRGGPIRALFQMPADGSGTAEQLTTEPTSNQGATSWSSDGSILAFYHAASYDVFTMTMGEEPVAFLASPFDERGAIFSPDDAWLAYSSNETGREEVYVTPYPGPGGKTPISTQGGRSPRWSADGRELFYRNGDDMMVVAVEAGPTFQARVPQLLFTGHFEQEIPGEGAPNYDVSADGQQFLMLSETGGEDDVDASPPQITVAINWFEELKARVPIP